MITYKIPESIPEWWPWPTGTSRSHPSISLRGLRIHEDLSQDSRNSNLVPPKYKPEALPSERTCGATLKRERTSEAKRIVQTIEYNILVARACKMRMTAHNHSSRTSHLAQYSTKTYAAVTAELRAIFKFGASLTVSSQLHAAAVEHQATQPRSVFTTRAKVTYAVCKKKCTAGSNPSCSGRSLATEWPTCPHNSTMSCTSDNYTNRWV
jgi:hypothetical protein